MCKWLSATFAIIAAPRQSTDSNHHSLKAVYNFPINLMSISSSRLANTRRITPVLNPMAVPRHMQCARWQQRQKNRVKNDKVSSDMTNKDYFSWKMVNVYEYCAGKWNQVQLSSFCLKSVGAMWKLCSSAMRRRQKRNSSCNNTDNKRKWIPSQYNAVNDVRQKQAEKHEMGHLQAVRLWSGVYCSERVLLK